MHKFQQYRYGIAFFLRPLVLWLLIAIFGSVIIIFALDYAGVGGTVKSLVNLGIIGLALWKGGHQALARWPPVATEADVLAANNDFTDYDTRVHGSGRTAAEVIRALEGNPPVTRIQSLAAALYGGTRTPDKRDTMWRRVDCPPADVFDRLFALHTEKTTRRLPEVIERLARDAPAAATPHVETLFEDLDWSPEGTDFEPSDAQFIFNLAALTLAHISRESPEIAERCTTQILSQIDAEGPNVYLVLALGELFPHDTRAKERIAALTDSHMSDVKNAARDILQYYEQVDAAQAPPYPAGEKLDRHDRDQLEEEKQGSGGGWEGVGYTCENCGTTLYMGDISGGGQYTCTQCGHTLDDQIGAGFEYWDEW